MSLASSVPWWLVSGAVVATLAVAYGAYAWTAVPLTAGRRAVLTALRVAALLLLVLFLLRPVTSEPGPVRDAIVSVLLDNSRSMRISDGTSRRIDRAVALVRDELLPALSERFEVAVYSLDGQVSLPEVLTVEPSAPRTDLATMLQTLAERDDGRPVAGIVVVSDGGDTSGGGLAAVVDGGLPPVFTVSVGSADPRADLEVTNLTAGDVSVAASVVELTAEVVRRGGEKRPITVRLLEGDRLLQVRHLTPLADGVPVRATFDVQPRDDSATRYTVEVRSEVDEVVVENNRRSVLVRPPERARRVLMVEGAPGFDHSFLKRVWSADPGVDLDAVVRKGQNAEGEHTFYVQGDPSRVPALSSGYPTDRAELFEYDAIVFANIEGGFFGPTQHAMTAEFVAHRGGGLLLLGSSSFRGRGLGGSAIEDVLPVELSDRGQPVSADGRDAHRHRLLLTDDGAAHPIMRLGPTTQDTREAWDAAPSLSGSVSLGAAKAGASVLALVGRLEGGASPLVAVQRYGRGRSMVFAGEAAWRWKMMMPAESRVYETFWGQVVRWLTANAAERVRVEISSEPSEGEPIRYDVWAVDAAYQPVPDATVGVEITTPAGDIQTHSIALADATTGRYRGEFRADARGVYRFDVSAAGGRVHLGSATEWVLVGGVDMEFVDPWSNDDVLRRVALGSHGEFLDGDSLAALPGLLMAGTAETAPTTRDLWHGVWTFLLVLAVLIAEWSLRRFWGMR